MQLFVKLCTYYANVCRYVDCISKICTKNSKKGKNCEIIYQAYYAVINLKYATNMLLYVKNMHRTYKH